MFRVLLVLFVSGVLQQQIFGQVRDLPYEKAFDVVKPEETWIIVLSTDWCPGCRTLRYGVLPEFRRRVQQPCVISTVDFDTQEKLAGALTTSTTIPQVLIYHRRAGGWYKSHCVGVMSTEQLLQSTQAVRGN